ncbi:MAG: DUF4783 domain-containing protein [Saprospiraceae bacterium]|nr:DUF4783 domain-containing protein [Saprospiraceae bacterium]
MYKYHRGVSLLTLGILFSISILGQISAAPISFMNLKYSTFVELRSSEGSANLSASVARQKMETFFKKVSPQKVKTLHKGFSKDKTSYYGIVQLITNSGNHRIFYYCESVNGEYVITKIRIHERKRLRE